jgi:predicted dehydrogenase
MASSGIHVAVIGAGPFGTNHINTLASMGALAGVAELREDLRQAVEERHPGTPTYSDVASLLATDVPAVVVATPAHTHFALAKQALEAGKDVLVEKPMTLASEDAEKLVQIARENDRILMVGHLLLYTEAIRTIKQNLEQGLIGRLLSLHQERLNLGKARAVENALWSLGVHDVAVALHLIGEAPQSVSFTGQSVLTAGVEDDTYLHMNFPSGVHAHIHNSWLWPETRRHLTLVGDQGMIVYDEMAKVVRHVRKRIDENLQNVVAGEDVVLFQGGGQPLQAELEHFIECVRTRATPDSDGSSGIEVVRVMELAKA